MVIALSAMLMLGPSSMVSSSGKEVKGEGNVQLKDGFSNESKSINSFSRIETEVERSGYNGQSQSITSRNRSSARRILSFMFSEVVVGQEKGTGVEGMCHLNIHVHVYVHIVVKCH